MSEEMPSDQELNQIPPEEIAGNEEAHSGSEDQHANPVEQSSVPPEESGQQPQGLTNDNQREGEESRVSSEKAWDMAHEVKDVRDAISELRHDGPGKRVDPRLQEVADVHPWAQLNTINASKQGMWAELENSIAEPIEEMAGLLHDHPISEEYKRNHPGVDFSPHALAIQYEWLKQDLYDAKTMEQNIEAVNPLRLVREGLTADTLAGYYDDGAGQNQIVGAEFWAIPAFRYIQRNEHGGIDIETAMIAAYGPEPKGLEQHSEGSIAVIDMNDPPEAAGVQKWHEYRKLAKNPDTTIGQLRALFIEAFRVGYVEPVRNRAQMVSSIVEDIRSGRASES